MFGPWLLLLVQLLLFSRPFSALCRHSDMEEQSIFTITVGMNHCVENETFCFASFSIISSLSSFFFIIITKIISQSMKLVLAQARLCTALLWCATSNFRRNCLLWLWRSNWQCRASALWCCLCCRFLLRTCSLAWSHFRATPIDLRQPVNCSIDCCDSFFSH